MRRHYIIFVSVAVIWIGGWFAAPSIAVWSMALATRKGEVSGQRARDRIVFFGDRAIQPIIASIEQHSPWARNYCYLPSALEKIGGSAQSDLLDAIGRQNDPKKRANLISALQTAFDDYSRFDIVLKDCEAGKMPESRLIFMASDIRYSFPDAPALLTEDRKLNPEFRAYWTKRSNQGPAGQPATRPESK